jgi:putative acetyltransferase
MNLRAEQPGDETAIRNVHIAAFSGNDEADLVDQLRGTESTFSFVAVESDRILGHIFFSPVVIDGECPSDLPMLGLAPLAVLPNYQRQGIGSLLVKYALKECARLGFNAIVVLGHAAYYPRFGFIPARSKGLSCEFLASEEGFMVLELERQALNQCCGTVKYRPEFNKFL